MHKKDKSRTRRSAKGRAKIRELRKNRLCVYRTSQHIYAQVTADDGVTTLVAASTLSKEIREGREGKDKTTLAKEVGNLVAKRALEKKISQVAFDRSGFRYHGRIKALADAAREVGLQF